MMPDHFYGMPARRRELGNTLMRPAPARVQTTFNAGSLIPLWSREMLPGETLDITPAFAVRSQTPIHPVLDDAYLDVYAFYVPNRIVLDTWVQVMGENRTGYWFSQTEHVVPKVTAGSNGFLQGSVADYYGLDTGVAGYEVNPLRFRGYVLCWNEFFRDQNTMAPAALDTSDTDGTSPSTSGDPMLNAYLGGDLLPVCRLPDYFSTCAPGPLKAAGVVEIGLPDVPLVGLDPTKVAPGNTGVFSPRWLENDTDVGHLVDVTGNPRVRAAAPVGSATDGSTKSEFVSSTTPPTTQLYLALMANTSSVGISINDFRFAFQLERLLERDLFGTRYTEVLQAHFGVKTQDARLQRPQLFGWRRYRLNQQQVVQTSATGSTGTPQGNLAAYSLTVGASKKWRIASPEHGFVHVFCCIRVKHTYQQGISRDWTRFSRYDYAWPEFVGLGNQPVYKNEIGAGLTGAVDANGVPQVFGYQEYAADYRYNRRYVTGQMRSKASGTLDSWHYADYYQTYAPSLGSDWMKDSSKSLIDRTLAVTSASADQFFGCFDFATELTTWLPMYSIPGFVDHF